jgi:hypothetical protein
MPHLTHIGTALPYIIYIYGAVIRLKLWEFKGTFEAEPGPFVNVRLGKDGKCTCYNTAIFQIHTVMLLVISDGDLFS